MKILQAVVASSVETIDGNQGFGLVRCSKALPHELRREAKDLGYSDDANGLPIYSFKRLDKDGEIWFILNRSMPAVDYTGRSSFVSHTLAFKESEWIVLENEAGQSITPFEFMGNFLHWVSTWTGELEVLEEAKDWELSSLSVLDEFSSAWEYIPNKALLMSFDYSDKGGPTAKRLAWSIPDKSPEEILRVFHQAWMNLDPWRGNPRHGDLLGEPKINLHDSWHCTFATNLRHGRPDPYRWVLITPSQERIQSRENIDFSSLPQEDYEIGKMIGDLWKSMLLERCENPEQWAARRIGEKLEETLKQLASKFNQIQTDIEGKVNSVFEEIEEAYQRAKSAIPSDGIFDQQNRIDDWSSRLQTSQLELINRCMYETHELSEIVKFLAGKIGQDPDQFHEYKATIEPTLPLRQEAFQQEAEKFKEARTIASLYEMYVKLIANCDEWQIAYKKLKSENKQEMHTLNEKLSEHQSEIEKQNKKLSNQERVIKGHASESLALRASCLKQNQAWHSDWKLVTIYSLSLVLSVLVSWYFLSDHKAKDDAAINQQKASEGSTKR